MEFRLKQLPGSLLLALLDRVNYLSVSLLCDRQYVSPCMPLGQESYVTCSSHPLYTFSLELSKHLEGPCFITKVNI